MKKIIVTGSGGQLAQCLLHHPLAKKNTLIGLNKAEADLSNAETLKQTLKQHQPDIIINAGAYTAVDLAESERDKARAVNVEGPRVLAHYCQDNGTRLINLSTDYVFNGENTKPYHEEDTISPVNFYGLTKAEGESAVRETLDNHIILRVSGVFSEHGKNFLKTMLKLASEREYLSVVNDQTTCPTDAYAIAEAIFKIIENETHRGTYHYCSQETLTWHHFAASIFGEAIARHNPPFKLHTMKCITSAEYVTPAKRPAYSVLNCDKIKRDFEIDQPSLKAGIDRVIDILLGNSAQ